MSEIQSIVNGILPGACQGNPKLLSCLQEIVNELDRVGRKIDDPPIVSNKAGTVLQGTPVPVTVFTYSFTLDNVILTWEAPTVNFVYYEIRQGSSWNTATHISTTSNLQLFLNPLTVGTHTFLIKTLNLNGLYSNDFATVNVVVPALGTFSITPSVIGNFVQLSWTVPTSTFRIDYYRIRKDGVEVASQVEGLFWSRQEPSGGTFVYGVTAYDIAGNASAEMTVSVGVSAPSDYDFEDSKTSTLNGTIVNGKVDAGKLYVCIDTAETYQNHFDTRSWASPQAQVSAGYNMWLSPFLTTASYEEIFDFGTILQNVIVNLNYLFEVLSGSFTFGLDVRVSDDGSTYSSAFTTNSFFVASVRYVKAKFTFTGNNDKALLAFSNFIVSLNVKREVDGGEVDVFAADTNGTVISFNKAFKFVESITVTPLETSVRTWVYDFAGGVNPTTFKVKLWNSAGTRVDGTVSWKARGVI